MRRICADQLTPKLRPSPVHVPTTGMGVFAEQRSPNIIIEHKCDHYKHKISVI